MWKIKDPTLKEKIMQLLSDESIAKRCQDQMTDGSNYILASDDDQKFSISIVKDLFENVPEYNQDGWNPFPDVLPPEGGYYLIFLGSDREIPITVDKYEINGLSEYWKSFFRYEVLAFRALNVEPPTPEELNE